MAPSAIDQLDEVVSKPPEGVVLPPKDIRAIVEKTAGYVARNGAVFEDRIRQKELTNPKFSFLASHDAYNSFYVWRLSEIRDGRGTTVSAGRTGEEVEPEKPKGPEPPPDFHFSVRMPNISAQDLDIVKLTALFVAKNGRSFATTLAQRESTKSQFDFLRPQHSLHQFYTRLIDQYTSLLNSGIVEGGRIEKERISELDQNVKNRFRILEKARKRAEWVKFQETEKSKKEEEAEAEKLAYAQIDWHDFVVVETVLFDEQDEHIDLPPPTSLSDLQSASLDQKAEMSLAPSHMRLEEAFPTEDDYPQFSAPAPSYAPVPPPVMPGFPIQAPYNTAPTPIPEAVPRIRLGDNAPRMMPRRGNVRTAMCPYCRQQIPMDELEQHMKIELLDPRWREQRSKAAERSATTNLSTQEVAENLKRLASQRTDVFDPVSGQPLSEEEQARMKRIRAEAVPQPQGAWPQQPGQSMNINDQLKSIHQRYGQ